MKSYMKRLKAIEDKREKKTQTNAEAKPVRHGYWIPVDGGDSCDEWECSFCGKWMAFQYDMDYDDMCEEFPRCPKCGAKMDGDSDV